MQNYDLSCLWKHFSATGMMLLYSAISEHKIWYLLVLSMWSSTAQCCRMYSQIGEWSAFQNHQSIMKRSHKLKWWPRDDAEFPRPSFALYIRVWIYASFWRVTDKMIRLDHRMKQNTFNNWNVIRACFVHPFTIIIVMKKGIVQFL